MHVCLPQKGFVQWLKIHFSELFVAWIHLKALRVFVESALRYVPITRLKHSKVLARMCTVDYLLAFLLGMDYLWGIRHSYCRQTGSTQRSLKMSSLRCSCILTLLLQPARQRYVLTLNAICHGVSSYLKQEKVIILERRTCVCVWATFFNNSGHLISNK